MTPINYNRACLIPSIIAVHIIDYIRIQNSLFEVSSAYDLISLRVGEIFFNISIVKWKRYE